MKPTLSLTLSALLLLAGCSSGAPAPAWQADAKEALDSFTQAHLVGQTRAAQADFARARRATSSTGRADLLAQVELVRCATLVASLEFDDCPGFAALAAQATPAQRAYDAYLAGRWDGLDPALLPPAPRQALLTGALRGVADPLARLVAAAARFKAGRLQAGDLELAIETASSQGWRRPLLTWLGLAAQQAERAGDIGAAARLRRRIALAAEQG